MPSYNAWLVFHPTAFFRTVVKLKTIAILPIFSWQMFKWAQLFSSTSSDIYSYDSPCYVHRVESPTFLRIPFVRRTFNSDKLFLRTANLWNNLPRGCFPAHNNLKLFKSSVNCYVSPLPHNLHSTTPHVHITRLIQ